MFQFQFDFKDMQFFYKGAKYIYTAHVKSRYQRKFSQSSVLKLWQLDYFYAMQFFSSNGI